MVPSLLSRYLVDTDNVRVIACRYSREQMPDNWSVEKLKEKHWEYVYGLVTLETNLVMAQHNWRNLSTCLQKRLPGIRVEFSRGASLAEELVLYTVFFRRDQVYARLALQHPKATV